MDFLNELITIQSAANIEMLQNTARLALFIYLPFMGIIIGGLMLSMHYRFWGGKNKNPYYLKYARLVIGYVSFNKTAGFLLGIIPLVTLILLYTVLYNGAPNGTVNYLTDALILFIPGFVFFYIYRYSFTYEHVFSELQPLADGKKDELEETTIQLSQTYPDRFKKMSGSAGFWSMVFMLAGSFYLAAALTITYYPALNEQAGGLFFPFGIWEVYLKWVFLLAGAFGIAGTYILFRHHFSGMKQPLFDYQTFIQTEALKPALLGSFSLPALFLVNLLVLPPESFTPGLFGFAALSILLLFLVFHFIYAILKSKQLKPAPMMFFVLVLSFIAMIVSAQSSFDRITEKQTLKMAQEYQAMQEEEAAE